MENNDKNKEKITHKHVASGPLWQDQWNLSVLDNWQIYSDSAADMKYNAGSISSFVACKRIFWLNIGIGKSKRLWKQIEVKYEYVM